MKDDVKKAIQEREELLEEAKSIELEAAGCLQKMTVPQLRDAVAMLVGIRRLNKEVDETFDEIIAASNKSLRVARGRKKKFSEPLTAGENIIKGKITDYYKQEAKDLNKRYIQDMKEATEAAALAREAEVEGLKASGMTDHADSLAKSPLSIVPVPKPAPTKMEGISVSSLWSAEIFDEDAVMEFALAHKEWHHLVGVKTTELNTLARMQKDSMSIPGARAVCKQSIAIRLPGITE